MQLRKTNLFAQNKRENSNDNEIKEKTIKEYKSSIGHKTKTKWEEQNNSNKCMGSGCIQMRSRNTTVERQRTERYGQKIKEINGNSLSWTKYLTSR